MVSKMMKKQDLLLQVEDLQSKLKAAEEKLAQVQGTPTTPTSQALQSSEIRWRLLAETTSAAIFITRDMQILYANDAAQFVTGYSCNEILGTELWKLAHPAYQEVLKRSDLTQSWAANIPNRFELKIVTRNGHERWLDVTAGSIEYEGQPASLLTGFDITERDRVEKELKKTLAELETRVAERTAALQQANLRLQAQIEERKQVEVKLQASEERWVTTLESIGDGVIATDLNGQITFMNTVAQSLTGWSLSEAVQKPINEVFYIINEFTRQEVENPVNRVLQAGDIVGLANHTLLIRKDGREIAIDNSGAPIRDDSGQLLGIVLVFRDISERKRFEDSLRTSEERYRSLVEMSPEAIFINRDNQIVYVNPAALELFGASNPEQLLGKSPFDVFHPDNHALIRERITQVLQGQPVQLAEVKFLRQDGKVRDVESIASRFSTTERSIQVILHDITDRKRSEEQMRLQSAALQSAANGIVITDTNGTIQWVNPAFSKLTGYSAAEVLGGNPRILKSGHHNAAFYKTLWDTIGGGSSWHGEIENQRKDGTLYTEEMTITPVIGMKGSITHFIAIKQDVTERKLVEHSLRESKAILQSFYDSSPFLRGVTELEGDTVIGVHGNTAAARLLGIHPDPKLVHGGEEVERMDVESHLWVEQYRRCLRERKPVQFEYREPKPIHPRWFAVTIAFIGEGSQGRPRFSFVAEDITARKQVENTLRDSEQKLRTLIELLPVGVSILNSEREVMYSNSALEKILGLPQNRLASGTYQNRQYLRSDRTPMPLQEFASVRAIAEQKAIYNVETGIVKEDGSLIWTNVNAVPVAFPDWSVVVVTSDVTARKQAEEAINSLARFPSENPNPVLRIESTGTLLYANKPSFAMLPDWHLEIGRPVPPILQEVVSETLTGGSSKTIDIDQNQGVISFHVAPVLEAGYANLYGRDITDRKQAEDRLRENAVLLARYQLLFEQVSDIILFVRLSDGQILEANRAAETAYGFSRKELQSLTIRDLRDPETHWQIEAQMQQAKTTGILFQTLHRRKDGSTFPVEVSSLGAEIEGVQANLSVIRDITERVQAEQALLASEGRFRSVLENALDAAYRRDLRMDRYDYISPVFEQITGWPVEDMYSADAIGILAHVHPDDLPNLEQEFARTNAECQATGRSSASLEYRFLCKDGQYRWLGDHLSVLMGSSGLPLYRAGILRDITDLKRKEAELSQLNRTLKALSDSNQAMLRAQTEAEFLDDVCRIIVEDCGHKMVWIGYAEDDMEKSVRPVAHAGFEAGYLETLKITWADTKRGRGPTGTAIRTGKSCGCSNMLTDPKFKPWRADAIKRGYASSMVIPMIVEDKVIGALTIYSKEPETFSESEVSLLSELANDVAYGIMVFRTRAAHAQAEEALHVSEERYRTLFSSLTEGFALHEIVCDEAGNPYDYRFLEINPSFEILTGLKRENVIGKLHNEVLPGDDPYWLEVFSAVALTGQPAHLENYSPALKQHYEVFAYRTAPSQFAVLFMNITHRKNMEYALRSSQANLLSLIENTDDHIWSVDPQYRLITSNSAFRDRTAVLFGHELVSGEKLLIEDRMPADARDWQGLYDRALKGEKFNVELKTTFTAQQQWMNYYFNPIKSQDGQTIGVTVIGHDITERKRAAEKLALSYKNLEFLSSSAVHFLQPLTTQEVFSFIGQQLQILAGDALVVVNELDPSRDCTIIHSILGRPAELDQLQALLGTQLIGLPFPVLPDTRQRMTQGELTRVEGGLYGLSFEQLPSEVCHAVEQQLGLGDIYAIPFGTGIDFLGTVAIITHGRGQPENTSVICALISQAGIALNRIRAEQQRETLLRQLESERIRWETTVESMLDPVLVANEDGSLIYMNPAYKQIAPRGIQLGIRPEEISNFYQLYKPDGELYPFLELPMEAAALRGIPVKNREIVINDSPGTEHIVIWNAAPLFDTAGRLNGSVAVGHDVTLQRQVEAERERLLAENSHQRKLLETMFEVDPSGIAIISGPDFVFQLTNPAYRAMIPLPELDPISRKYDQVWTDPANLDRMRIFQSVMETGMPVDIESDMRVFPNGITRFFSTHFRRFPWESENGLLIILQETTQIEEISREAQRRADEMNAIFTSMTDAVTIFNPAGNPILANPAAVAIYGYDPVGNPRLENIKKLAMRHPNGQPFEHEELPSTRALRGETLQDLRFSITNAEGIEFTVDCSASPLFSVGAVSGAVLVLHDVTERERLHNQLSDERARFKAIFENAPQGIVLTNAEGQIILTNPAADKLYERPLSPSQNPGEPLQLESCHPDGIPFALRDLPLAQSALDGKTLMNVEIDLCWSNGICRHLLANSVPIHDFHGKISGALGVFQDVTELKQTQADLKRAHAELEQRVLQRTQELAQANEALRIEMSERKQVEEQLLLQMTAVKSAANGIIITDRDGKIQWCNPAFLSMTGFTSEEVLGRNPGFLNSGAQDREFYRNMWNTILSGQVWRGELTNKRKDGTLYVEEQAIAPVFKEEGILTHFVSVRQDISERKRFELQLEQNNEELRALSTAEHKQRQLAETLTAANMALSQSLNLGTVMETLLDYVGRLVPFDRAKIFMLESETRLVVKMTRGYEQSSDGDKIRNLEIDIQGRPILRKLFSSRKGIRIPDTSIEPGWETMPGLECVRSWLGIPLLASGNPIGVFTLEKAEPDFFTLEHIHLADMLVGQAVVAVQNAWLFEQVRAGHERLQSLSRRLVEIQEIERRFVARELHDEAGQALTGLIFGLGRLGREDNPLQRKEQIEELKQMTSAVLESIHRLAVNLRPASLDHLGLVAALSQYMELTGERYHLTAEFVAMGFEEERLAPDIETALYRIVQEATTNAVRHGQARSIDVLLERNRSQVILVVEDDGIGFDADLVNFTHSGRLGLLGMQERAEMLGGSLVIESAAGKGTTIVVKIPNAQFTPASKMLSS